MYYSKINKTDIANGDGVRVSLFVSGCRHHCKGCFNKETWNFKYGKPFTEETVNEIIKSLEPDYIQGLSILGGEPFEPDNQPYINDLLKKVTTTYPNKDIWVWTGCLLEELDGMIDSDYYTDITCDILSYIDYLIDGKFIEDLKDITLKYRGSTNQRVWKLSNKE